MRHRVGKRENISDKVYRNILKWFDGMKRISGKLSTKKVYVSEVQGGRTTARPSRGGLAVSKRHIMRGH